MRYIGLLLSLLVVYAIGVPVTFAESNAVFKDVSVSHWAAGSIAGAVAVGYVNGYPDGTFKPENNVTRAEFLRMIVDALQLPHSQGGVPWYQPYVAASLEMHIHDEADFKAYNEPITRLEIVRLVARSLMRNEAFNSYFRAFDGLYNGDLPFTDFRDIQQKDVPYLALVFGSRIISGYPDASFGMEKNATRAEAVTMINGLLGTQPKSPESFQYLNELKEVAETGMNATAVSNLIPQVNLQKEQPVVEHKNFTAKFKRLYVVPVEGDTVSLYERKYLWNREELPSQFLSGGTRGYVVAVADVTFKVDGDRETFGNYLYMSPSAGFYYQEPYNHYKFIYPWMKPIHKVKKNQTEEIVFYGYYDNEPYNFRVGIQCNNALNGTGWHQLLFNPEA